jgi:YesN/AraC family two-component response regulator
MLTYLTLLYIGILKLEWDYMISFSMSIFIVIITIASYVKPEIFNDIKPFSKSELKLEFLKYKNSPIDNSMSRELAEKLQQTMIANLLWRKNDLRLEDLSKKMELPKHYVSQVINEQFNMNFFEFVNKYRIDEAKKLIQQENQTTLIEIAYQVGFNNKVSFGKAFKNNTNLSPLEYKKKLTNKELT